MQLRVSVSRKSAQASGLRQPLILRIGDGHNGKTKLAKENGASKDRRLAHPGESALLLQTLAGLDANERILWIVGVDGDHGSGADSGFALTGVVNHQLFALFH